MTIPTPSYTQLVPNCNIEWSIFAIDQGVETGLTDTQKQYVELQIDGSINIDVGSDYTVENQVWTFKLKATSTVSNVEPQNVIEYQFSMNLKDICWDANLQAANFVQSTVSYFLFADQSIVFDNMIDLDNGAGCGGYTYSIQY